MKIISEKYDAYDSDIKGNALDNLRYINKKYWSMIDRFDVDADYDWHRNRTYQRFFFKLKDGRNFSIAGIKNFNRVLYNYSVDPTYHYED